MKRLWIIMFLLCACAPRVVSTINPIPKPTLVQSSLYPTSEAVIANTVLDQSPQITAAAYQEISASDGQMVKTLSLTVISSGKVDRIELAELGITLDVVWVFQRNAAGVVYYPLVVGAQVGEEYLTYYTRYPGQPDREAYLDHLAQNGILERGRFLMPGLAGEYLDRLRDIDWLACGEGLLCQVGGYMQTQFSMDHPIIAQAALNIPAGWALAWPWDAATEQNSLFPKIILPEVESGN